jgi:TolA-binding protein
VEQGLNQNEFQIMKINHLIALVAATAMFAGCKPSEPPTPDVKTQVSDAASNAKDSMIQAKDDFVAASQKKIHELDAKIDELSARSANLKDDSKVKEDQALADLRVQREKLNSKFDDLKMSTQDGWDKTKIAFSDAWDKVEKAYDDAKAKITQ